MKTKTIELHGKDYIISVEELADSFQGKVMHNDKWIIKMDVPKSDADDLKLYHGENLSDLLFRILEGYVKSGFKMSVV